MSTTLRYNSHIPDIRTLVSRQQVQIEALGKQDDIFRETIRRMLDQLTIIAKDTAEIKGRLAAEKPVGSP